MATTWNPSDLSGTTLSGGNLTATASTATGWVRTVNKVLSGGTKIYWEINPTTWVNGNTGHGFCPSALGTPSGSSAAGGLFVYRSGSVYVNAAPVGSLGGGIVGSWLGFALNATTKLAWIRVLPAGSWTPSGDPALGTGGYNVSSILSVDALPLAAWGAAAEVVTANFGDSAFVGTIPSGFTTLAPPASLARPMQTGVTINTG